MSFGSQGGYEYAPAFGLRRLSVSDGAAFERALLKNSQGSPTRWFRSRESIASTRIGNPLTLTLSPVNGTGGEGKQLGAANLCASPHRDMISMAGVSSFRYKRQL
jgi:hypothetical protein